MIELVERFDHTVLAWLDGRAGTWLDPHAIELTAPGDGYTVTIVVVVAAVLLWIAGARIYALLLAVASAGAAALTPILKNTFERPRPGIAPAHEQLVETSYAYPSGHALLATVTLAMLAFVVHRLAGRRSISALVGTLAAVVILLTGWSRIQLGLHHPSDVVAGFAIGLAWAVLCASAAELLRTRRNEHVRIGNRYIPPHEAKDTMRMTRPAIVLTCVLGAIAACGVEFPANAQEADSAAALAGGRDAASGTATCEIVRAGMPLPAAIGESSGLARGSAGFWTHNDGDDGVIYRVDASGRLLQIVALAGVTIEDFEEIDSAPCDAGLCLYVGDLGDNDGERTHVAVHRLPEPAADATRATPTSVRLTYADGPRDAEAFFVDTAGAIHVVTKGRREEIALYRASADAWQRGSATLERVRVLFPRPDAADDRVTAAALTPDGSLVGVRTYRALHLFPRAALTSGAAVTPVTFDISPLNERQGEALVIGDDGSVWTTSEAESRGATPSLSSMRCALPAAR